MERRRKCEHPSSSLWHYWTERKMYVASMSSSAHRHISGSQGRYRRTQHRQRVISLWETRNLLRGRRGLVCTRVISVTSKGARDTLTLCRERCSCYVTAVSCTRQSVDTFSTLRLVSTVANCFPLSGCVSAVCQRASWYRGTIAVVIVRVTAKTTPFSLRKVTDIEYTNDLYTDWLLFFYEK